MSGAAGSFPAQERFHVHDQGPEKDSAPVTWGPERRLRRVLAKRGEVRVRTGDGCWLVPSGADALGLLSEG
jgi:hypothetical protein